MDPSETHRDSRPAPSRQFAIYFPENCSKSPSTPPLHHNVLMSSSTPPLNAVVLVPILSDRVTS
jgi:hypothetical protein